MRTFSLGAGADTVVFESTPGANGVDEITGFTITGAGKDKLDFTTSTLLATASSKFETFSTVSTSGAAITGSADGVIVLTDVADLKDISFDTSGSTANKVKLTADKNYIIITDTNGDNTAGNIYYVSAGSTVGTDTTTTLIGTVMRDGDAGDYVKENFTGIDP